MDVKNMSDREIAEETLTLLRGFAALLNNAAPMLETLSQSPVAKALLRMGG